MSLRVFSLAAFGVICCAYALVRYYTRAAETRAAPTSAPAEREIPAPELVPAGR